MKNSLRFSAVISFSLAMPLACGESESYNEPVKPNILILLADDMGYRDIGPYRGVSRTPNLDNLAGNGIIFSDFYAAAPNCSPSRAALLTGRAPTRTGLYSYRPPNHPMHLPASEITIARILKDQGYQTAHIGKWHLGSLGSDFNHPQPGEHGFDYFFSTENNAEPSHMNPENFIRNGSPVGQLQGFSSQIVADEAISWFETHKSTNDPFFMYVAFHEPHESTQKTAPPDLVKNYSQYPQRDANYFANVENLDSAIGKILNHLIETNLFENTIIIFSSDNGSYRQASNGELKAVKSYLYEGGIRVPAIFHWQGFNNEPNTVITEAAGLIDIMPTLCEILQIDPPHDKILDGTSILGLLKGKDFKREIPMFWFFYRTSPEIAVRSGNYMIMGKDEDIIPRTHQFASRDMTYIKNMDLKEYELYDLNTDISQTENLIHSIPDGDFYIQLVNSKLEEIQAHGYYWEGLPLLDGSPRRIKTEINPF
jgi:arylsulfatase A